MGRGRSADQAASARANGVEVTTVQAGDAGAVGAVGRRVDPDDGVTAPERQPVDDRSQDAGRVVGRVTSAVWSPRLAANVAIGMLDNAARPAFLLYLPFLLQEKGAALTTVGLALSLVFVGGALGKAVCGRLGEHLGVTRTVILTETGTALAILAVIGLPLAPGLILLPLLASRTESVQQQIDHAAREDEDGGEDGAGEDDDADRLTAAGPRPLPQHQGQGAEGGCDGGHDDGAQAQTGGLHGGLHHTHALITFLRSELHNQNRVFRGQADEHHHANLKIHIVGHAPQGHGQQRTQ